MRHRTRTSIHYVAFVLLSGLACGEHTSPPAAASPPRREAFVPPDTPADLFVHAPRVRAAASVFYGETIGHNFAASGNLETADVPPGPVDTHGCVQPRSMPRALVPSNFVVVLADRQLAARTDVTCIRPSGMLGLELRRIDGEDDDYASAGLAVAGRAVAPDTRLRQRDPSELLPYDDALRADLTAAVRPSLPPELAELVDEVPLVAGVHAVRMSDECPRVAIVDEPLALREGSAKRPNVATIWCLGPSNELRAPILAPLPGVGARFIGSLDLEGDGLASLVVRLVGDHDSAWERDIVVVYDVPSHGFVELGGGRATDILRTR